MVELNVYLLANLKFSKIIWQEAKSEGILEFLYNDLCRYYCTPKRTMQPRTTLCYDFRHMPHGRVIHVAHKSPNSICSPECSIYVYDKILLLTKCTFILVK